MMKKLICLFVMFTLCLAFPGLSIGEFYVIRLKNGGTLATPIYWFEGTQVHFFYVGGTVGVEKQVIEKVEKHKGTKNFLESSASDIKETKETKGSPSLKDKSQGPEKPLEVKKEEEKINIADYKNKKDKLTAELDNLLDKRREAGQRKDEEARAKLTEEIRKTSAEVYVLTDEVKAKNKGNLPKDWWVK